MDNKAPSEVKMAGVQGTPQGTGKAQRKLVDVLHEWEGHRHKKESM